MTGKSLLRAHRDLVLIALVVVVAAVETVDIPTFRTLCNEISWGSIVHRFVDSEGLMWTLLATKL